MADEYELDDGPKAYVIDPDTLEETTIDNIEDRLKYQGVERLVLLVEDVVDQRENLEKTAIRYFSDELGTKICTAANTDEALRELKKYQQESPDARLAAVLDYNMVESEESLKPTEALFYDSAFQHYLNNGGVVILNSGFPEQVRQSETIMESPRKYENLLLFLAVKGAVQVEDVFRVVKRATKKQIPVMKRVADKFNYDLSEVIKKMRK
jgi:hypothetical protein